MSEDKKTLHKGRKVNSSYAWLVVLSVVLTGLLVGFARLKVPAMMGTIIAEFQVPVTSVGWLMGVFSLTSIILAIPAGIVVGKIGTRKSVLISLICVMAGCLFAILGKNFPTLMVGRIFEGISYPLIGVVGPATVSLWFSKDRRGLPAAIWSLWAPVGSTLAMAGAPSLLTAGGWSMVYIANIVMCIVVFAYVLVVFKDKPDLDENGEPFVREERQGVTFREAIGNSFAVMKMPALWILVLCQFAFASVGGTTQSYANTYMQEAFGLDIGAANALASVQFISCIIAAFIVGALSDRLKKRKAFIVSGYVVLVIVCFLWMIPNATLQWLTFILIGVGGALIPSQVYASPGEVIENSKTRTTLAMGPAIAAAMGMITLCSSIGNFLGPVIGGYFVELFGYQFAVIWCLPILVIMLVLVAWKLKLR